MKYLITHTLSKDERQEYENKGLYCYDLRSSDIGNDIATIEKRVIVNRIGSMITNKEIYMKTDHKDYNEFVLNKCNKSVNTIGELFTKNKEREAR